MLVVERPQAFNKTSFMHVGMNEKPIVSNTIDSRSSV